MLMVTKTMVQEFVFSLQSLVLLISTTTVSEPLVLQPTELVLIIILMMELVKNVF